MTNTTMINNFNSENGNIAYIKSQNCQIMANITNIILKFKPTIKRPIMGNHTFFA